MKEIKMILLRGTYMPQELRIPPRLERMSPCQFRKSILRKILKDLRNISVVSEEQNLMKLTQRLVQYQRNSDLSQLHTSCIWGILINEQSTRWWAYITQNIFVVEKTSVITKWIFSLMVGHFIKIFNGSVAYV